MIQSLGRRLGLIAILVTALLTVGGCGSDAGQERDPLGTAATRVGQLLERAYSNSYAGIEVDDDRGVLVVYRKPDAQLESAARAEAGDLRVVFRDARFSLDELTPLVRRVEADIPYWREQGMRIRTVVSRVDGSGINVTVHESVLADARTGFRLRYSDDRIDVVAPGSIEPVN